VIIEADNVDEYLEKIPQDRKKPMTKLRNTIVENIPEGFQETISYGMIGYVVPHSIYPKGYHCDTKLPLPFINIASQKNYIALYHLGLYANQQLLIWFQEEYKKVSKYKLDMGKSCIRFKKIDNIPYELIGELVSKISVEQWIKLYEER
jgi:uncharacterized protein YdhG (YjbR/CyaY superfamily)